MVLVFDELVRGADVGLHEGEEGAFVFLVIDYEGHRGELAVWSEDVS